MAHNFAVRGLFLLTSRALFPLRNEGKALGEKSLQHPEMYGLCQPPECKRFANAAYEPHLFQHFAGLHRLSVYASHLLTF